MSQQYYLVTGAAGFIGYEVCYQLLESGAFVVGVDNLNNYYDVKLKTFRLEKLRKTQGHFYFYDCDIESIEDIEKIFKKFKFDVVFNLAARAGVRYSMENPSIYMTTNALGSLNILELMKKYECQKYVLASTSSLYAGQEMPFREDLSVNTPISPYAATKKAAEVMAYTYHHLYKIDVSIVRYFTVYGPLGRPDMAILRFIRWIDEGTPITMYGDGEQSRDFTYLSDIASGTILAGQKYLGNEIINLGGGNNPTSMNLIIQNLEKLLGKKAKIIHKDFHQADMKTTWASIEKADKLLGWKPTVELYSGLERTVKHFMDHHDFYCSLDLPPDS